ncbi:MAG: hypothetical protein AABW64_01545 [Nanoarchaeota archaeon]
MALESEYASYQKKYSLPSYQHLNQEFEFLAIGQLQQIDFPLRFMRRRMTDRIAGICNFFQTILQPNPGSYVLLKESSFFTGDEKQQIQRLLYEAMVFLTKSTLLDSTFDEKADAAFIRELYKFWMHAKPQYRKLLEKLEQGWQKKPEQQKQAQNHYFG